MKRNQKLQNIKRNRKDKNQAKCIKTTNKEEVKWDSTALVRNLRRRDIKSAYIKKMDTKIIPYEIPEVYSLNKEIENLVIIETRMDKLSPIIRRTDIDAMSADWKKVGGDINEAILKFRRIYAGKFN